MPSTSIDQVYMKIAYNVSELSYAERRKVGCVIVKDHQIVSFGYNGTPKGFDNECEQSHTEIIEVDGGYAKNPEAIRILEDDGYHCNPNGVCGKINLETKREVLHAESNAITKIAKSTMSSEGADLYTTTTPCFECSKLIIQSGIKRVFYTEDYRDMSGQELLAAANIEIIKI
mgnify:CR=1 FL=1